MPKSKRRGGNPGILANSLRGTQLAIAELPLAMNLLISVSVVGVVAPYFELHSLIHSLTLSPAPADQLLSQLILYSVFLVGYLLFVIVVFLCHFLGWSFVRAEKLLCPGCIRSLPSF